VLQQVGSAGVAQGVGVAQVVRQLGERASVLRISASGLRPPRSVDVAADASSVGVAQAAAGERRSRAGAQLALPGGFVRLL
jgi:hypothetical protein